MKDYRKMSRAELLACIEKLKSRPVGRSAMQERRVRSALRDREKRLRAILETAVEGIITIDERGIIETFNTAAERIFGYAAREIVGRNVSVLMPSPHREHHDAYISKYCRTGHASIIGIGREVMGQRKDGTVFPMDLAVSEVRLANSRVFTGIIRDITELKRLQREVLEISEREQRRIGHDLHDGLCQELAGIELMSQVLAQNLSKRSRADAARAADIARNVREAIGHTRSLARGLSPVTLESGGLMAALQELAANAEKFFKITCRFDCDPPVPVQNPMVASHLFRITQEAVSNAVKHGRAKRVSISLHNDSNRVVLCVNDNGRGFRAPPADSTGMGMRIMQFRAGVIGGLLSVERAATGGVTVVCSAPNPGVSPKTRNKNGR